MLYKSIIAILAAQVLFFPSIGSGSDGLPNIILIVADGAGYSDLGCYGGEIHTPHLDRLASEGLRFAKFYNNGLSSPTRASLMTGQYPHCVGLGESANPESETPFSGYLGYLNTRRSITIAEALREVGYRTWIAGKWHLGGGRRFLLSFSAEVEKRKWPLNRGFDRFFGVIDRFDPMNNAYWQLDMGDYALPPSMESDQAMAITDFATRWIKESTANDARPFFLYLPFTDPHALTSSRFNPSPGLTDAYRASPANLRSLRIQRAAEQGVIGLDWKSPTLPLRTALAGGAGELADSETGALVAHASAMARLDLCVGRIVDSLNAVGKKEETLILYLSANGADTGGLESQAMLNAPFVGGGGSLREGGIATPLIAHWPNGIESRGRVTHEVGHVFDLLPTFLEIAGSNYPKEFSGRKLRRLDGKSLLPVFRGESAEARAPLFWDLLGEKAVRKGSWKYYCDRAKNVHLYNLESDGAEAVDLARDYPQVVADLASAHASWAEGVGVLPVEDVRRAQKRGLPRQVTAQPTEGNKQLNLDEAECGRLPSEELKRILVQEEFAYKAADGEDVSVLPYFLYRPAKTEPGKTYPLILWLAGCGPVEAMYSQRGFLNWMEDFLTAGGAKVGEHPFFVLVPGGSRYAIAYGAEDDASTQQAQEIDQDMYSIAIDMIDHAVAHNPIDPDCITATGISQGGSACWELAMRYPDRLAAIAPIASSPYGNNARAADLTGMTVWAFHNALDPCMPVDGDRKMVNMINQAGGNARLTSLYRARHNAWSAAFQEYQLRDWLAAQRRGEDRVAPHQHLSVASRTANTLRELRLRGLHEKWLQLIAATTIVFAVVVACKAERSRRRKLQAVNAGNR